MTEPKNDSPPPLDGLNFISQRHWRRVGAVTIAIGAILALYAVVSDVLRDSILHAVRLFGLQPADSDLNPSAPFWFIVVYWLIFTAVIVAALYCAMLDLRFIRMQYALQKREIFGRTIGEDEFRKALLKHAKDEDQ